MSGTREHRMIPGAPFWTDERVEVLKARFLAGDSFSQMAKLIGHGATRNSCIGKCTRMGMVRVGAAPLNAGARSKPRQLGKAPVEDRPEAWRQLDGVRRARDPSPAALHRLCRRVRTAAGVNAARLDRAPVGHVLLACG